MQRKPASRRARLIVVGAAVIVATVGIAVLVRQGSGTTSTRQARAVVGPVGTIWVADEDGDSLTAIDARTAQVRMTARGIAGPHNVQVSDDGEQVWAVSGRDSMLIGIDAGRMRQLRASPTGLHPAHVVISPAGDEAYVTSSEEDVVTAVDLASGRQRASAKVGEYPHGLRISPDGRYLLVANMRGTSVSLVDRESMRQVADIEVGKAPVQVAWMPDSRYAFVSLNAEDAVVKVDVQKRKVVGRAGTGHGPAQTFVTADGDRLLVANQGTAEAPSHTLSVIDPQTMKTQATIKTGKGAHGITADPTGRYAFVTNMFADDVAFVDLDKARVVARTNVGSLPNGISFSTRSLSAEVHPRMDLDGGDMPRMSHDEGAVH